LVTKLNYLIQRNYAKLITIYAILTPTLCINKLSDNLAYKLVKIVVFIMRMLF